MIQSKVCFYKGWKCLCVNPQINLTKIDNCCNESFCAPYTRANDLSNYPCFISTSPQTFSVAIQSNILSCAQFAIPVLLFWWCQGNGDHISSHEMGYLMEYGKGKRAWLLPHARWHIIDMAESHTRLDCGRRSRLGMATFWFKIRESGYTPLSSKISQFGGKKSTFDCILVWRRTQTA